MPFIAKTSLVDPTHYENRTQRRALQQPAVDESRNVRELAPTSALRALVVDGCGAAESSPRWRASATLAAVAQRRERPAQQQGGKAFDFRLSDGRTISVPVNEPGPAAGPLADGCCFCGQGIEADVETVEVVVRWIDDAGEERSQGWAAHRACLAGRMHETVRGVDPFFGA
jgi:hypothetical protein